MKELWSVSSSAEDDIPHAAYAETSPGGRELRRTISINKQHAVSPPACHARRFSMIRAEHCLR